MSPRTPARLVLIGPLSHLLSFSGLDLDISLCGDRRSRFRAACSTLIFILVVILFLVRTVMVLIRDFPGLSYSWADTNCIGFAALHSLVSLVALARWTSRGIYSRVYAQLLAVRKLRTDAELRSCVHSRKLLLLTGGLIVGYVLVTITASVKRTLYRSRHWNVTEMILYKPFFSSHNLYGVEILVGAWMALCTALATSSYVLMHVAVREEINEFNNEITAACANDKLMDSLEAFSLRHIALLKLVFLLTDRTNTFVSFSTLCVFIEHINVFYIISAVGAPNAFGTVMCVLWGISTSALLPFILSPPGTIQILLEKATSTVANHRGLIERPEKLALAQLMVDRNRETPTRMAIMKAIIVNAQTPHLMGLLVPLIVAVLSYARQFH